MIATLRTRRLQLRPLDEQDEALYVALYGDADTMQRIVPAQAPAAAARGFLAALAAMRRPAPARMYWVMQSADDARVGLLGLDLGRDGDGEVGALIPPPWQGRGYATEAIAALADHAFGALGLKRLHTRHADHHPPAAGLMRTLGFAPAALVGGPHPRRWELTPERWAARCERQRADDRLT